jgi:hypothetical protein
MESRFYSLAEDGRKNAARHILELALQRKTVQPISEAHGRKLDGLSIDELLDLALAVTSAGSAAGVWEALRRCLGDDSSQSSLHALEGRVNGP